jgi:membrane protease YdiL (CAAX protease family)
VQNNSTWARWQPSPTTWPPEAFPAVLTILAAFGVLFVAFVAVFVFFVSAVAAGAIDRHDPLSASPDVALTLQIAMYLPVAAYLAAILPPLAQRSLRELGLRAPTGRDLAIALAGIVVMFVVVSTIESAAESITHRHDTEAAVALMQQLRNPLERLIFVLIAIVLAPLVEELVFRVFLFNAVSRYTPIWAAALISGLLFGAIHVAAVGQFVTIGLPLAFGGIVLAYVYALTRCYWANVLTHAGFNAIGVAAVMLFHQT